MARETGNITVRLVIVFIGMIFEASQVYISCAIKLKVPRLFNGGLLSMTSRLALENQVSDVWESGWLETWIIWSSSQIGQVSQRLFS